LRRWTKTEVLKEGSCKCFSSVSSTPIGQHDDSINLVTMPGLLGQWSIMMSIAAYIWICLFASISQETRASFTIFSVRVAWGIATCHIFLVSWLTS